MPKITEEPVETTTQEPKLNKKQRREEKRKAKDAKSKKADRPVVHEEVSVQLFAGEDEMTVEKAKELLGWEEETEEVKFGAEYQMTDLAGVKVRTKNNTRNRPWEKSLAMAYAQDILRRRWRLNGETLVVDKTDEICIGQHRCSGLILAEQIRVAELNKWEEEWPNPVTMPAILVLGVDGSDDTVNTMDTGKPRSVADILYRSLHFAHHPANDRKKICRQAEYAVRLVWARTGAKKDAYAPISTRAECVAFLDNHKTLKKCIEHVFAEDKGEGKISKVISAGTAAGLCYLMAAAKADGDEYRQRARNDGLRQEKGLDMDLFDRACEFWLMVGQDGTEDLKPIRHAIKRLANPDKPEEGKATMAERIALVIKAWNVYAEGRKVIPQDLKLTYKDPEDENDTSRVLTGTYEIGGIDLGDSDDDSDDDGVETSPTEEEVEEAKVAERDAKVKEMTKTLKANEKAAKEQKKAEMAGAVPPSGNDSVKSATDEVRELYAPVIAEHPGKVVFFKSRTSGAMTCIDDQAERVSKITKVAAVKDPSGFTRLSFPRAEVNLNFLKLLKAKVKIAVAEEVVSGMKEKSVKVKDYVAE